jgi:hypothetical protein
MPTQSKHYRLSDETVDQMSDLIVHYRERDGLSLNEPALITAAIDRLHAAVCRPVAAGGTAPKRTRTAKD